MKTSSGGAGGIQVSGMQFSYDGQPPLFVQFDLEVSPGSRCLLIGANGSGKLGSPRLFSLLGASPGDSRLFLREFFHERLFEMRSLDPALPR